MTFEKGMKARFRELFGQQEGILYKFDCWNSRGLRFDWSLVFEVDGRPHLIAANTEELEPVEELPTVREKLDAVRIYPEDEPRRPDDVGDAVVTAWNAANPPGTSVWFHLDTGSKLLTKTRSAAWLFADRIPVVLIA